MNGDEGKEQFRCDIPASLKEKIKLSGWKHAFIVEEGYKAIKERKEISGELRDNVELVQNLRKVVERQRQDLFEMQDRIKDLEDKNDI